MGDRGGFSARRTLTTRPQGAFRRQFIESGRGLAAVLVVLTSLAGCATYRPVPLSTNSELVGGLDKLITVIPAADPALRPFKIDTLRPLTIEQIGLLAMLNNPNLKTEFGTIGQARAELVQATLLPNPVANISYGSFISGPTMGTSVAASLSQSFATLLTRRATIRLAKAHLLQVDAEQLWQEWQVAQKARQLALDIYWAGLSIGLTEREQDLLTKERANVKKAIDYGGLSFEALAPLDKAIAGVDQSLIKLRLDQLKNWQALDGILGLLPTVRFKIAPPHLEPLPRNLDTLIAAMPQRRPDLHALRLGYESADQDVRAAILAQFPPLTIGGSYSSETLGGAMLGPTFGFTLPAFDHSEGQISKALAGREQVHAKYQATLDDAVGTTHGLAAQIKELSRDLLRAQRAAKSANSLAAMARQAYALGNHDQRTLTDYETTALDRALEVLTIQRQIDEDKVFLGVELGLGLPAMRMAFNPEALSQGGSLVEGRAGGKRGLIEVWRSRSK